MGNVTTSLILRNHITANEHCSILEMLLKQCRKEPLRETNVRKHFEKSVIFLVLKEEASKQKINNPGVCILLAIKSNGKQAEA